MKYSFLTIIVCIILAGVSQAELIYIAIEAEVDAVSDSANHLEGRITTSSTITGYYCYESATSDTNPLSSVGSYWHYASPPGMYFTCGGFNFDIDPNNVEYIVEIADDKSGRDKYAIQSYNNLSLSNGVTVSQMFWQLEDSLMTALSSTALPTTAPVLGDWDDNRLYISGGPRETEFWLDATVTSATVVPEPVTILLLSLGALSLRKRSQ